VREVYGFTHVFAHNGEVLGIFQDRRFEPKYYFPLGDTDSERAFCALMDRLREGLTPAIVMDFETKLAIVEKWAREVSELGVFNFLLSDSRYSTGTAPAICSTSSANAFRRPSGSKARI
jgi:glutamine amidotransferase